MCRQGLQEEEGEASSAPDLSVIFFAIMNPLTAKGGIYGEDMGGGYGKPYARGGNSWNLICNFFPI